MDCFEKYGYPSGLPDPFYGSIKDDSMILRHL